MNYKPTLTLTITLPLITFTTISSGVSPLRAGHEPGELGELRLKLIDFLETSKFYTPERLLAHFPFEGKEAEDD